MNFKRSNNDIEIMLIGYAANYAQEVERNVPTRMYFLIMILSGMMGMGSDQLPEPMKTIAYTLPTTYISNEFIDFWQGQHYNFMPLIQSFLFFGTLAGIVVMLSLYQKRKSA